MERRVDLSSLDKVMWPATGFTKGDMVRYYERVAPVLIPHIAQRPVTLARFPDGIDGPGFAQTECRGAPEWLATTPVRLRSGEVRNYCLVNDLPSLLWVANLGTIELHPFLGRAGRLHEAPAVLFDLDPEPPAGLADCARVALLLRAELADHGLHAVAKGSGSAGMHVLVPLNQPHRYDRTRSFARGLAERLAAGDAGVAARANPRSARAGKVLVDWSQNSERRSTVAAYSLRATDDPRVSAPVTWEEIERCAAGARALAVTPAEALDRVERLGDLFEQALTSVQELPPG